MVGGQMAEAMLVDKLFLPGPGTPPPNENYWTQAVGMKTGNPDSASGYSPAPDTSEGPDTHDPLIHVRTNQAYDEGHISSSYSDITLEIGGGQGNTEDRTNNRTHGQLGE